MNRESMFEEPGLYMIRVKGHLEGTWAGWFEDFEITLEPSGESCLMGRVSDQDELHKVITKIRDLGMPLLSVERMAT